ncbi:hypothetical protein WMY93_022607 [Mugilogobius chulae]|uniref:Uncharacterized protein n=1 Tax=Mugilogobius chulae TaxID=88201 RepID=A0AAW0NI14_9GOBI
MCAELFPKVIGCRRLEQNDIPAPLSLLLLCPGPDSERSSGGPEFDARVCGVVALWHSHTEQHSPPPPTPTHSKPDTGDERSRQACKRGVPSRPACLSVCPAELRSRRQCEAQPTAAPGKIRPRDIQQLTPD